MSTMGNPIQRKGVLFHKGDFMGAKFQFSEKIGTRSKYGLALLDNLNLVC